MEKIPPKIAGARKGCKACLGALKRMEKSAYVRMVKVSEAYGPMSDQFYEAEAEHKEIKYISERWMYLIEGRAHDLGIPGV